MEYTVEKYYAGDWYYEGKGDINYVNRVIKSFIGYGQVIRIKENAQSVGKPN